MAAICVFSPPWFLHIRSHFPSFPAYNDRRGEADSGQDGDKEIYGTGTGEWYGAGQLCHMPGRL